MKVTCAAGRVARFNGEGDERSISSNASSTPYLTSLFAVRTAGPFLPPERPSHIDGPGPSYPSVVMICLPGPSASLSLASPLREGHHWRGLHAAGERCHECEDHRGFDGLPRAVC